MHFVPFPNILIGVLFPVLCTNAFPLSSESELALVPSSNETTLPTQESPVECYGRDPYSHRASVSEDACVAAISKILQLPQTKDDRYFTWNKYKDGNGVFRQSMWSSRGCYVYVRADFHRAVDRFSLLDVAESALSITSECVQRVSTPMGGHKEIGRTGNSFYVGVAGTVPTEDDLTTDGNSTKNDGSSSTEIQARTGNATSEVGLPNVVCWSGEQSLRPLDIDDCEFVIESRIPRIAPEMAMERWGYTGDSDIRLPAYWGYHRCFVAVSNLNTAEVDIFTTLELEITAKRIVNQCTGPGTNGLGGYCAIGNGKGFYATVQNPPPHPGDGVIPTGLTTGNIHYNNVNDLLQNPASPSLTSRNKGLTVMLSDSSLLRKRDFRLRASTADANFTNPNSTYTDSPDVRCIPPSATSAAPTPAIEVDPGDCQILVDNLYIDLLNQTHSLYKNNTSSPSADAGPDNPDNYYPIIPQTSRYQSCFAVINSTAGNGNTYTPPTLPSGNSSDGVIGHQVRPVPLAVPQQPSLPSVDAATFFQGAYQVVEQCLVQSDPHPPLGGVILLTPSWSGNADGSSSSTQDAVQIYLTFSAYDAATDGSAEPGLLQDTLTKLIASTGGTDSTGSSTGSVSPGGD